MNPSDEIGEVDDLLPNGSSGKKVRKRSSPQSPNAAGGGKPLGDAQKIETAAQASSKEAPGDTVGDRYEIVALVGEGDIGVLYRAKDPKLGREVALKRLQTIGDPARKGVERFLQEARAIAALNHRNIVTIYDLGEDDKGPFIVMEYLKGEDLRSKIEREEKIGLDEALSILKGVGRGLAYAHNRGIIHRNVKPANILLTEDGTPKLVDFGLAPVPGKPEISKTGDTPGTWAYVAPEQMSDAKHVDQRSDIYALAKTLYHMVAGSLPDPIDLDAVPSEIRPALEKALKPTREDRPLSVKEFLNELGQPSAVVGTPLAPGTVLPGTCLNCGANNPQGTRFCQSCGAGLFEKCPRCNLEGPLGVRNCGSCGVNVSSYKEARKALSRAEEHLKKFAYDEAEKEARRGLRLGCLKDELKGILEKAVTSKKQLEELRAQALDLIEKERYEDAEQPLRAALELDPSHEELKQRLKGLPARIQERDIGAALTEGGNAIEEKRFLVALERCEWVLTQQDGNKEARELRSQAEKLQEDHRARVAKAKESLEASQFDEALSQLRGLEEEYTWDDEIKKLLQEVASRKEENVDELRAQALDLIEKERYEDAERPLRAALELDPSHEELKQHLKGLPARIQEREVRSALTEAGKAIEEKRFPVALDRCDWVLARQDDNKQAVELRSRAEKLQEDHRAGAAKAKESLEASRFDEALSQLRSLEKEYPWDDEIKKLLQEVAIRKKGNVEELRAQALDLIEKERYEDAERPLRAALELDPSQEELARHLKELPSKIQERDIGAALTEAGKALEEKRYLVALERSEWVLGRQPHNEEAGVLRLHAEKLRTDHQSRLQRARTSLDESLLHKALEQLSELERDYPWDEEIRKLHETGTRKKEKFDELRAQALDLIEKERYEDAEQPLRAALELDPSREDLQGLLEELPARIRERDIRRALTEARKALENKRYTEALERCDSVLQQQPENKEAADLKTRAEKLREDHQSRLERAGKSLEAMDATELNTALGELKTLEKEFPWDKKTSRLQKEATTRREWVFQQLHDTAMEHVEKGEYEDAEEPLRGALELDPSQKELERLLKELPARDLDRKVQLALEEARKALREKRFSVAIEHGNWVLIKQRRNKEAADIVTRAKRLQKRAKAVATFGDYEAVGPHARTVGATVWTARPMGSTLPSTFAVKAFDSSDSGWDKEQVLIERDALADSIRIQQKVAAGDGQHWAPILDCATEDEPFFVTKYYRRSAQGLLDRQYPLSTWDLHAIVSGVVEGLEELKQACGRSHGNLKPSNVLIEGEGRITPGKVALTDPLPSSRLDDKAGERSDLQAIGTLIYRLVLRRPFRLMGSWPIPQSEAWSRLGKSGETWRKLCDRLLDPDSARSQCSLRTVAETLRAIEKPRKVRTYALAGAGAVVIATASVLFVLWLLGRWTKEDARRWESLCLAHKEWFVGFLEDTKDSARQKRWGEDPHLGSVLKLRGKVKPGHDPRQIAKRRDASYQDLARTPPKEAKSKAARKTTREALDIVEKVRDLLTEWPVKDDLSRHAEAFEGCGLRDRSQRLISLVRGLAPGKTGRPPQDISERIDRAMAVAEGLKRISAECAAIVGLREKSQGKGESWRAKVIAGFDASFQTDTRYGEAPFGDEDFENLQNRLPGLLDSAKQIAERCDEIESARQAVELFDKTVLTKLDGCLMGEIAAEVDPNIRENLNDFADKMSQLAKTVNGISEVCSGIEPDRQAITKEGKTWGSKVLPRLVEYLQAAAGSAKDLEDMRRKLGEVGSVAKNLVIFLKGDWQAKMDRELFIKEGEDFHDGVPTRDTFVSWLEKAKPYFRLDPDPLDSWFAKKMLQELESAKLTKGQKENFDQRVQEKNALEKRPKVVKYGDEIKRGMASLGPKIRDLHFEVLWAENWKRLCDSYDGWFAGFLEDTKDSARQQRWAKDPHLVSVLKLWGKVKLEHDPRQIAKRRDASYQDLVTTPPDEAKSEAARKTTREALEIVEQVAKALREWPGKEELSGQAKEFKGRGWGDRSQYLASLVQGLAEKKPGYPLPDIADRIDGAIVVADRLKRFSSTLSEKCTQIDRLRQKIQGEGEKWRSTLVASFDGSFAGDTRPRQAPCSEQDLTTLQRKLEELVVHGEQIERRCQTIHGARETIKRSGEKVFAGFDAGLVGKVAMGASPSSQENLKSLAETLDQAAKTAEEIARLCTRILADQQTIEGGGTIQSEGKTWKSKVLTKFGGYVEAEVSLVTREEAKRGLEVLKERLGEVESTGRKVAGFVKGDWPTEVVRELFIDEGEVPLPDTGVPGKETFESWLERAKGYYKLKGDPRVSWAPEKRVAAIRTAVAALPPADSRRENAEVNLKKVEAQVRTVRELPGIERSRKQVQETVQNVDTRLDQIEFGLFFAEKWEGLCLAYEGWFEKFLMDTADPARQARWQKDAYLKDLLAVREKVKPEYHPQKIANRSDVSLSQLAKSPTEEVRSEDGIKTTKEALEIVEQVAKALGDWPRKEELSGQAKEFKGRGWGDRSQYLASLVQGLAEKKPGYPPPDIADRIDGAMAVADRLKKFSGTLFEKCAEIDRLREKIQGEGEKWRSTLVASFDGSFAGDTRPRQAPCSEQDLTTLQRKLEELVVHGEQIERRCQTIHGARETIKRSGEKVFAGFDAGLVGKVAMGASPSSQENLKSLAETLDQAAKTAEEIARLCPRILADQQTIEGGGTIQSEGKTWKSKVLTKFGGYVEAEVSLVTREEARRGLEVLKERLGQVESTGRKVAGFVKGDWPTEVARELFIDEGEVPLPDTGVPGKETFESWLERAKGYYKLKGDPRASWTPEKRVAAIRTAVAALPAADTRHENAEVNLKKVEAQVRTVRELPGIERSRKQVQDTVQNVDLRLDQIEFGLFFAEKWEALCLAYEGWFEKFLMDTADPARQARWQKDAYLKDLLAVREKVKPEYHPQKIANRSDVSLSQLAKSAPEEAKSPDGRDRSKAALELIRDIGSRFQSGEWAAPKSLTALAGTWKERKWGKPAAYLELLPQRVALGPELAATVDEILAFEEQTRKEIESCWKNINADRQAIEVAGSGDQVLKRFGEFVDRETASAPGKGTREDVEELRKKLNELEKLSKDVATFVTGPWKDRVDQQWFKTEVSDQLAQTPITAQLLRETWLADDAVVKGYYRIADPRTSWDLDIDRMKDLREKLEKRRERRTVTEQEFIRLSNELDRLKTAITAVRSLPPIERKKAEIEAGMKKSDETYAVVRREIEGVEFNFEAFFNRVKADFPNRAAFRKHFRDPRDADALRARGIAGSKPHSLILLSPKGPEIQPLKQDEEGNPVFEVLFRARFEVTDGFIRGKIYPDTVSQKWTIQPGPGPDEGQIIKVEPGPIPLDVPDISWRLNPLRKNSYGRKIQASQRVWRTHSRYGTPAMAG